MKSFLMFCTLPGELKIESKLPDEIIPGKLLRETSKCTQVKKKAIIKKGHAFGDEDIT